MQGLWRKYLSFSTSIEPKLIGLYFCLPKPLYFIYALSRCHKLIEIYKSTFTSFFNVSILAEATNV